MLEYKMLSPWELRGKPTKRKTKKKPIRRKTASSANKQYLKKQKGSFHLPLETIIYVPSTTRGTRKISATTMKNRIAETRFFLARLFGGYTSVRATGGYVMKKNKKLVKEKVVKVTSYSTKSAFRKGRSKLIRQIGSWKRKWGQESIGVEFEGDMFYL